MLTKNIVFAPMKIQVLSFCVVFLFRVCCAIQSFFRYVLLLTLKCEN